MRRTTTASTMSLYALLVALVLLAGCADDGGDDPSDQAVDALREVVGQISDGQYGRAYEGLHPAQRDLLDRDQFDRCYSEGPSFDAEVDSVQETYEETVTIPGTDQSVDALAITAEFTVSAGDETETTTDTFRMIDVDGEWTWIYSAIEDCLARSG